MKLHLKELCRELGRAKEEETVPTAGVNPYLLEKVFRPALRGEAPMIRKIDYDQFEEEDIGGLCDYYESMWKTSQKLELFAGAVANLDPVACRNRRFC